MIVTLGHVWVDPSFDLFSTLVLVVEMEIAAYDHTISSVDHVIVDDHVI